MHAKKHPNITWFSTAPAHSFASCAMGCSIAGCGNPQDPGAAPAADWVATAERPELLTWSRDSREATAEPVRAVEAEAMAIPRRTVKFNEVLVFDFYEAQMLGSEHVEIKLVTLSDRPDRLSERSSGSFASAPPDSSLQIFLQAIEAAPHILETKVATKRSRDFTLIEI